MPSSLPLHVNVSGLRELRRDLKRAEQLEDMVELRNGLKAAAGIVATEAKQRASVFSQRAANTIRPTVSGTRAYVAGGKASLPWYGWADFGSRNPVAGRPVSVGPWKGSGDGPGRGRFIYAAFDAKRTEVERAVETAVDRALNRLDL
jgi:hypothetical protein